MKPFKCSWCNTKHYQFVISTPKRNIGHRSHICDQCLMKAVDLAQKRMEMVIDVKKTDVEDVEACVEMDLQDKVLSEPLHVVPKPDN